MATKETNMDQLGADRISYRAPVRDYSNAGAKAAAQAVADTGELALRVDEMRQQGKMQKELERERGGAELAGKLFDELERGPRTDVPPEKAGLEQEERLLGLMMEANPEAAADVRKMYGDLEGLRAAHAAGKLTGGAWQLRVDDVYRRYAAARPGYREQYRALANQFMGFDVGSTVNRRIFGFGPDEDGQRTDKETFEQKTANKEREWLMQNHGDKEGMSWERVSSMSDAYVINFAGYLRSREAGIARDTKRLELIGKDSQDYTRRAEAMVQGRASDDLNVTVNTLLNRIKDETKGMSPEEYNEWYGTVFREKYLPQITRFNVNGMVSGVMSEYDIDPARWDATAQRNVVSQLEQVKNGWVETFSNPAELQLLTRSNDGAYDLREQTAQGLSETFVRMRAVMGQDAWNEMSATLIQAGSGIRISQDLGAFLRSEQFKMLDTESAEETAKARKEAIMNFLDPEGDLDSAMDNYTGAVIENGTGYGTEQDAQAAVASDLFDQSFNTLLEHLDPAQMSEDQVAQVGQRMSQVLDKTLSVLENDERDMTPDETIALLTKLNDPRLKAISEASGVDFDARRQRIANAVTEGVVDAVSQQRAEGPGFFRGLATLALDSIARMAPGATDDDTMSQGGNLLIYGEDGEVLNRVSILKAYPPSWAFDLNTGGIKPKYPRASTTDEFAAFKELSGPGATDAQVRANMRAFHLTRSTTGWDQVDSKNLRALGLGIQTQLQATGNQWEKRASSVPDTGTRKYGSFNEALFSDSLDKMSLSATVDAVRYAPALGAGLVDGYQVALESPTKQRMFESVFDLDSPQGLRLPEDPNERQRIVREFGEPFVRNMATVHRLLSQRTNGERNNSASYLFDGFGSQPRPLTTTEIMQLTNAFVLREAIQSGRIEGSY